MLTFEILWVFARFHVTWKSKYNHNERKTIAILQYALFRPTYHTIYHHLESWVAFCSGENTRRLLKCIMMTSSNGNIFRVTGHLCGEFTGPGEFPTQRPVTRSFDVYFDLRLSKQSLGWWFETLSPPLWRLRNGRYSYGVLVYDVFMQIIFLEKTLTMYE